MQLARSLVTNALARLVDCNAKATNINAAVVAPFAEMNGIVVACRKQIAQ